MTNTVGIVLAGGKGTRLKSALPKVLHQLLGKSLIQRVLETLAQLQSTQTPLSTVYLIVGHQIEAVKAHVSEFDWPFSIIFVTQSPQLGTGHAVQQVLSECSEDQKTNFLITCGDMPLVQAETYQAVLEASLENPQAKLILATVAMQNPSGYGRVILNSDNTVEKIIEERDANDEEKEVSTVNTGIYAGDWPTLAKSLKALTPNNSQKEYYLTDCVEIIRQSGQPVLAVETDDENDMLGINSRQDLAVASILLSNRSVARLMDAGVSFIQPDTSVIAPEVEIGSDSTVHIGCTLIGDIYIGEGCQIGPHTSLLDDVTIGNNCQVLHSVLERGVVIGENCYIGPYAHLRDETMIGNTCKIGNFVEVKQAIIGNLSNAAHLSYIGDAQLGDNVNMGAGSVIANYDPIRDLKHQSLIEDDVKIGCNSTIISPVTIEKSACVAAGSTITEDVDSNDLAIARGLQKNIPNWVSKTKTAHETALQ